MKKNLYLFKASVMVYADNVVDALGLVTELNDLHNTCCYVDDQSALKITDKKSLTEWLEYCPLEFIERGVRSFLCILQKNYWMEQMTPKTILMPIGSMN